MHEQISDKPETVCRKTAKDSADQLIYQSILQNTSILNKQAQAFKIGDDRDRADNSHSGPQIFSKQKQLDGGISRGIQAFIHCTLNDLARQRFRVADLSVELPTTAAIARAPTSLPKSVPAPDTEPNAEGAPVQAIWTPNDVSTRNHLKAVQPTTSE